jgi:hypothetical protein
MKSTCRFPSRLAGAGISLLQMNAQVRQPLKARAQTGENILAGPSFFG